MLEMEDMRTGAGRGQDQDSGAGDVDVDVVLEMENVLKIVFIVYRLSNVGTREFCLQGCLVFSRDVNEPGPSPQARKPAGTFPSPPGPQPAFFSPHLQIHQYYFLKIP